MLLHSDVRRMVIGAGLDYNDLRVKQLAKAAFDLGCKHERERMIYAGPHEWAKEAIKLEREACSDRAWIALVKHGQPWNVRQAVTEAIREKETNELD